jgi:hypothetical protein
LSIKWVTSRSSAHIAITASFVVFYVGIACVLRTIKGSTTSKALLWLNRSLHWCLELFQFVKWIASRSSTKVAGAKFIVFDTLGINCSSKLLRALTWSRTVGRSIIRVLAWSHAHIAGALRIMVMSVNISSRPVVWVVSRSLTKVTITTFLMLLTRSCRCQGLLLSRGSVFSWS